MPAEIELFQVVGSGTLIQFNNLIINCLCHTPYMAARVLLLFGLAYFVIYCS